MCVGQMEGQFQTVLLHLRHVLEHAQQQSDEQGQVSQQVDEDGVAFEHHFPEVHSAFELDDSAGVQQAVAGEGGQQEGREEQVPAGLDPFFVKYRFFHFVLNRLFRHTGILSA